MQSVRIFLFVFLLGFGFQAVVAQDAFNNEGRMKTEADRLFLDQDYAAAYPLYSQLVSVYPKNPEYNYRFGVCILHADPETEKAIPFLEFAMENDPKVDKKVYFYMGRAYHLNYNFGQAISYYQQYLQQGKNKKEIESFQVNRRIEMCNNGKRLLSKVSDLYVLNKRDINQKWFFRSYEIDDEAGKILALSPEFSTSLDQKKADPNAVMFITPDKNQIFFGSYGKSGETGKDIYRVAKMSDGKWSPPINVGNVINTPYDEDFPYLTADGKTLYFCSRGHNSMGGFDIFRSNFNEKTQQWSTPENLDFAVNTPYDDILFIPDAKERFAWFSSNRSNNPQMISHFRVRIDKRPVPQDAIALNSGDDEEVAPEVIQKILQKAKLDVNADESQFANEAEIANSETDDYKTLDLTGNVTSEDVIKLAFDNAKAIQDDADLLNIKSTEAVELAGTKSTQAENKMKASRDKYNMASNTSDNSAKERAIKDAQILQYDADKLKQESAITYRIAKELSIKAKNVQKDADQAFDYARKLENALKTMSLEDATAWLEDQNLKMKASSGSDQIKPDDFQISEVDYNKKKEEASDNKVEAKILTDEARKWKAEAADLRIQAEGEKKDDKKQPLLAQANQLEKDAAENLKDAATYERKAEHSNHQADSILTELAVVNEFIKNMNTGSTDIGVSQDKINAANINALENESGNLTNKIRANESNISNFRVSPNVSTTAVRAAQLEDESKLYASQASGNLQKAKKETDDSKRKAYMIKSNELYAKAVEKQDEAIATYKEAQTETQGSNELASLVEELSLGVTAQKLAATDVNEIKSAAKTSENNYNEQKKEVDAVRIEDMSNKEALLASQLEDEASMYQDQADDFKIKANAEPNEQKKKAYLTKVDELLKKATRVEKEAVTRYNRAAASSTSPTATADNSTSGSKTNPVTDVNPSGTNPSGTNPDKDPKKYQEKSKGSLIVMTADEVPDPGDLVLIADENAERMKQKGRELNKESDAAFYLADQKTRRADDLMKKAKNAENNGDAKGAEEYSSQAKQMLYEANVAYSLANNLEEQADELDNDATSTQKLAIEIRNNLNVQDVDKAKAKFSEHNALLANHSQGFKSEVNYSVTLDKVASEKKKEADANDRIASDLENEAADLQAKATDLYTQAEGKKGKKRDELTAQARNAESEATSKEVLANEYKEKAALSREEANSLANSGIVNNVKTEIKGLSSKSSIPLTTSTDTDVSNRLDEMNAYYGDKKNEVSLPSDLSAANSGNPVTPVNTGNNGNNTSYTPANTVPAKFVASAIDPNNVTLDKEELDESDVDDFEVAYNSSSRNFIENEKSLDGVRIYDAQNKDVAVALKYEKQAEQLTAKADEYRNQSANAGDPAKKKELMAKADKLNEEAVASQKEAIDVYKKVQMDIAMNNPGDNRFAAEISAARLEASVNKAEDKKNKAAQLRGQATQTASQAEKEKLMSEAMSLELSARDEEINAYEEIAAPNQSAYSGNKNTLKQVYYDNSNEQLTIARMLYEESQIYFNRAQETRAKAETEDTYTSKKALLKEASDNELIALKKQQEALNILRTVPNISKDDAVAMNTNPGNNTVRT
ncbi:MAG: hypothetical protein KKA07_16445, partial [Bacteroidetes bacterium]|nr:hypothetical protein [Bacteroidota bacterium]